MLIKTLLLVVTFPLRILPTPVILFLGDVLGLFFLRVLHFRRSSVEAQLRAAFPKLESPELKRILRENYKHYGKTFLEVLSSLGWNRQQVLNAVIVEGKENLESLIQNKQGAFLITLHLGNWEYALQTTAALGTPLDVIVKQVRTSAGLNDFLTWYRTRHGATIHFEEGSGLGVLSGLTKGRIAAFPIDQFMGPPIGIPIQFFGQTAGTAASLALMSEKRPAPIFLTYSFRDPKGKIHIVYEKPIQFPPMPENRTARLYAKMQYLNDVLETKVRQYPEQWLWLHRRWKRYDGVPRWKLAAQVCLLATGLGMGLSGCVSPQMKVEIEVPPDPVIEAPKFSAEIPIPTPEPPPSPVPKRSKKKHSPASLPPSKIATSTPTEIFQKIDPSRIPFKPGEHLEFNLSWMTIPAGRVSLEVRSGPMLDNRPTYHYWGNILSSRLADAIYHVDNTIESFVDQEGLIPYKYLLHMLETSQTKETRVAFDHLKGKAHFWSKRISTKWGNEDQDRQDAFQGATQDMFSALFLARTLDYEIDRPQTIRVYENNQILEVGLLPVLSEMVSTKKGTFQCWKIQLTVKLNNILKPSGDMFLWVSADPKKYIVKFDAKLKLGSLHGILTEVRES